MSLKVTYYPSSILICDHCKFKGPVEAFNQEWQRGIWDNMFGGEPTCPECDHMWASEYRPSWLRDQLCLLGFNLSDWGGTRNPINILGNYLTHRFFEFSKFDIDARSDMELYPEEFNLPPLGTYQLIPA